MMTQRRTAPRRTRRSTWAHTSRRPVQCTAVFPGLQVSSSRPPRQGGLPRHPVVRSTASTFRDARPLPRGAGCEVRVVFAGRSLVPFIPSGRWPPSAAAVWSPGRGGKDVTSGSPRFSASRGDIVIWAILVLLGVPLWLCAIGILVMVFRNRSLRGRAADIPMRLRVDAKGRWHRGHGLRVHDVLGFRGSPAAWNEALLWRPAVPPAS
jgi:hypothetical protein